MKSGEKSGTHRDCVLIFPFFFTFLSFFLLVVVVVVGTFFLEEAEQKKTKQHQLTPFPFAHRDKDSSTKQVQMWRIANELL